jgi:hypothetical protein
MITVIRDFPSVLRRYRLTAILNILGLLVAFAAFVVMMMKVNSEYGFDRSHPNADRIYRVDWLKNGAPSTVLPRAFADAIIASSPQIEEGTIIMPLDEWMGDVYLTTGNDASRKGFHLPFKTCYPSITRIFGFEFTEGDPYCLDAPGNAIIPQSIARRMFVAIIISIVGMFGLILLETQYRCKEIGIRKVFGSTSAEILSLFNRTYIRILCVGFVLAAPVAYYGVSRWMENFAYKTSMDWWVYLLAFAAVLALTAATVTFQNWRGCRYESHRQY